MVQAEAVTGEQVADGQAQQLAPLLRGQLPPVVLHARVALLWRPLGAPVAAPGPPAAARRAALLPLRCGRLLCAEQGISARRRLGYQGCCSQICCKCLMPSKDLGCELYGQWRRGWAR